jgi:hypothetical protein
MPEDEIRGEGFTIKDRRTFDTEGKDEKAGDRKESEYTSLPEVNFSSFVLSLSSSILLHLGEIEDPQSGEKKKDLALAKQTIDIITILKDKTKGNLTDDEQKLLEYLLYDLRMRFVKATQG